MSSVAQPERNDGRELAGRIAPIALVAGLIGLGVFALGTFVRPAPFFRSYLIGFAFWFGIAVGNLAVLMVWHLTGGGWGVLVRRIAEAATRTLPLLAGLFLPVLLGVTSIYLWTDAEAMYSDPALAGKLGYFNLAFFTARAAIYFAIWIGLAWLLNRWSVREDQTRDPRLAARMRTLSGPGLVFWGLALTFAAVDWVMSLQPRWSSTIFPVIFGMGQVLAAFAFTIVVLVLLRSRSQLAAVASPRYFQDLGNLLLALVMFWAYVSFSQVLLIWAGNLPEEVIWYLPRIAGGWKWAAAALALFQFAVPFGALLFRRVKRQASLLGPLAGLVLAMSLVNVTWQVLPSFRSEFALQYEGTLDPAIEFLGLAASLVGVGGVWVAIFLWQLRKLPLLSPADVVAAEAKPDD